MIFDHAMMSGVPPIGLDLNLGLFPALLLALVFVASTLGILHGRMNGRTRRLLQRWLSHLSRRVEQRPPLANLPRAAQRAGDRVTLGRAIRLTTGSRK
jgi:hypothetical protein